MEILGSVAPPLSPVRDVFADVLAGQPGTGASFPVWHDGDWVVDLWGQYAASFLTGHIGDHDRGDRLESGVRDVLGLAPM